MSWLDTYLGLESRAEEAKRSGKGIRLSLREVELLLHMGRSLCQSKGEGWLPEYDPTVPNEGSTHEGR